MQPGPLAPPRPSNRPGGALFPLVAMANVAFIPGFCGTELWDNLGLRPFTSSKVWVDYARISSGALAYLDLAPNGTGPGPMAPDGVSCRAGDPEPGEYSSLMSALRDAGHKVLPMGWDWRKDIISAGGLVGAAILGLVADDPVWIVAHSAGGLVARAAVQHITNAGKGSHVKGIIYLGTPYFGTFYPIATVCREADMYRNLALLMGKGLSKGQVASQIVLDTLLAHLVGLWELLPCYGYGPLWEQDQERVEWCYNAPFYSRINAQVSQARLDKAKDFWTAIKPMQFRDIEYFIGGDKQKTPVGVTWVNPGTKLDGAAYAQVGDNTVDYFSAIPADAGRFATSSEWTHEQMPKIRDLQTTVLGWLP